MIRNILFLITVIFVVINAENCTNPIIDCNGHGKCVNNICVCDRGYTTHDPIIMNTKCDYKQMNRKKPFLLHILTGWATGAGFFTLGHNIFGFAEMIAFVIIISYISFVFCEPVNLNKNQCVYVHLLYFPIFIMMMIIMLAFWIWGIVGIATGSITDGNGVETYWN